MGKEYGKFKYEIGTVINTYDRNIEIIDCEYREKRGIKNGVEYIHHEKWYKYRCNECGNEDWIREYCLNDKAHIGCNVCCIPPKKIVKGINDITTTAPWMVKYFADKSDAESRAKYSKDKIKMICPYCGKVHHKSPYLVTANNGLSCVCGDGVSYPNKFMYSLLTQLNVNFETEKRFEWSENRFYDDYVEYNGLKIIIENHGKQHYDKPIIYTKRYRSVEEEQANDLIKENLAYKNGIDRYFQIDCSESDGNYIKNSIVESGLLYLFDKSVDDINWKQCTEFATSNLAKSVCEFKKSHMNITLCEIANIYHIAYGTVLNYVKVGNKFGWCHYNINDDLKYIRENHKNISCSRPIHCISTNNFYRDSKTFVSEYYSEHGKKLCERNIRHVCEGKRHHVNNLNFQYITQEQFNEIKKKSPAIAHGDFFIIKEKTA